MNQLFLVVVTRRTLKDDNFIHLFIIIFSFQLSIEGTVIYSNKVYFSLRFSCHCNDVMKERKLNPFTLKTSSRKYRLLLSYFCK